MPERPWNTLVQLGRNSRDVLLVAPYIKLTTLTNILELIDSNATITCVTRWNPQDILSGVSDLECRSAIKDRNGIFKLHPSLHAKYYRFDEAILVGSANLTATGLGYLPISNLEILHSPSVDFNSADFEQVLVAGSREITDEEFEQWTALKTTQMSSNLSNLSESADGNLSWWPHTQDPEHLWFFYTARTNEIASYDERASAAYDINNIGIPPGLSRQAFDIWITSYLLASPFIHTVLRLEKEEVQTARAELAESWEMSRAAATRNMETAKTWIATFIKRERRTTNG